MRMQQPAGVVMRAAIRHLLRFVVCDAHERIGRCGSGDRPHKSFSGRSALALQNHAEFSKLQALSLFS